MPNINVPGVGIVAFPDDMSHEQIGVAIRQDILPGVQKSGFGAGIKSGIEGLKGAYHGLKYGITESPEDLAALKASQAKQEELYQGPGWEDVKEAFKERGVGAGLGRTWEAAKGTLGQSIPYMAAPVAAAALAPEAAVAGVGLGTLGFLGTSAAQYTGQNIGRQVQEGQDVSLARAAAASVPAALLDRFALGQTFKGTGLGKLFGQEGKEAAESVARKIVEKGTDPSKIGSILAGGARGIAAEIPNEVGQQILERAQAGLSLTDADAIREYKEAAFGATLLGGPFGGVSGSAIRGAGIKTAQGWEQRAAEETAAFDKREAERLKAMETTKTSVLDGIRLANEKEAQRLGWQGDIQEVGAAALDRSLTLMDTPEGVDTIMGNMKEYFPGTPAAELKKLSVQLRTYKQRMIAQEKANAKKAEESAFTQNMPDIFGEYRAEPTTVEGAPTPLTQTELTSGQVPTIDMHRPELQLGEQRAQPVQGELALGEQPTTPPRRIDADFLKGYGLKASTGVYKGLAGLDLNNDADLEQARVIIADALASDKLSTKTQERIDEMARKEGALQEQGTLFDQSEVDKLQQEYNTALAEGARDKRNQGLAQLLVDLETENAAKKEASAARASVPSEAGVESAAGRPEPSVGVYAQPGLEGAQAGAETGGRSLGLAEQDVEGAVEAPRDTGGALTQDDLMALFAEQGITPENKVVPFEQRVQTAAEARAAQEKTIADEQAKWDAMLEAQGLGAELEPIPTEEYETDEAEQERRKAERKAAREERGELTGELAWPKAKFSEGREGGSGVAADTVRGNLMKWFSMPARFNQLVEVVQSASELPQVAQQELSQAKDPNRVQAFVGEDGKVYLIADNIVPGEELGVFLHELGAHVGMEGLIGPANVRALTGQVMKWADMGNNTQESQIAQRAMARAEQSSAEDKSSEVIAYFVEEAVKAGVNPTAIQETNSPLGRWFRKLWAAAKVGLRKLGMGKIDKLTAQNIVDLAYGAAHLELSGAWHGTAADFRKFNHMYMGTGEGAQVYGWGSYLAQRPGIAHGYWKADTRRKESKVIKLGDKTFNFEEDLGKGATFDKLHNEFHTALMNMFPNEDMDALEYVETGMLEGDSKGHMLDRIKDQQTEWADSVRNILSKIETAERPEGELMRVSYNANENELLDWDDAPTGKVLNALQTKLPEHIQKALEDNVGPPIDSMTGGDLYAGLKSIEMQTNALSTLLDPKMAKQIDAKYRGRTDYNGEVKRAEEVVSMYLDSIGIKGTKYLDAESRTSPEEREHYIQTHSLLRDTLKDQIDDMRTIMDNAKKIGEQQAYEIAKRNYDFATEKLARIEKNIKELEDFKPTRNIVVFNDKNIVRAVSYKGAEKGKVRFSEAADRLAKMGREVKQVEDSKPFQERVDQIKEVVKAPAKWRDLVETMVFSADAKINNEIRRGLMDTIEQGGQEAADAMAKLYSISTSQALHNEAVAHQFIEQGNVKYNPELFKYEAVEDKNSWANMVQELKKIADQYGFTFPEMEAYAQAAIEARRLKGINEFNAKIEKEADALDAKGKKKLAEKHREKLKLSHMTDEQIETGLGFFKDIPELNKIVDMWNGIRKNAMEVGVESGIFSKERADELLEIMDYVPFYRVEQLEAKAGPKEFSRGLLDAARDYRFKGSEQEINNIFDNMERWASYTIRRSVNNKTAQNLVQVAQEVLQEAKEVPKAQRGMEANTVAIWQNGERKFYEFSDPLFVKAFTGLEPVALPAFKALSTFSNALRKNIVLNPLFSVSQLSQDSFAAMLTSGLKHPFRLPLEVMKEFIKTLRGTSEAHQALKAVGAAGVRDYSATISRLDAEMAAGLKAPSTWQKLLSPLEKFSMASDNAVRQAIYNMTMQETGGDKAKAIERAFEIINFRRKGASGTLAIAGQVIPFFNAYLQAQNVAYKVLTGRGVSPTARSEAKKVFIGNATKIAALAFMYAAVMSDDDDYKKMDPTIRDRHWIIPGTGLMLPVRTDLFSMPKIIAEHTYALMTDQGFEDGTKARRAMTDALVNAITGPTPVPQAFKPMVEVVLNRNFYTGRPIIGRGIENLTTAEQYTAGTSELAKAIGSTGIIAPVNVDHLIRGYLGTTGGLTLMAMDTAINSSSGVSKPSKSTQDVLASTPGLSTFVSKEFGGADKTDFYELKGMVDEASATLNRYKKTGRLEAGKEYLGEEQTQNLLKIKSQVNQIQAALSKLRERENLIREMPDSRMSADQKEVAVRQIREQEQRMLSNVSKLRKLAGL